MEVGRELLEQGRQGGSMWFRFNIFCFQLRGLGWVVFVALSISELEFPIFWKSTNYYNLGFSSGSCQRSEAVVFIRSQRAIHLEVGKTNQTNKQTKQDSVESMNPLAFSQKRWKLQTNSSLTLPSQKSSFKTQLLPVLKHSLKIHKSGTADSQFFAAAPECFVLTSTGFQERRNYLGNNVCHYLLGSIDGKDCFHLLEKRFCAPATWQGELRTESKASSLPTSNFWNENT